MRTLSLRIRCVDATGQIVPCNVVIPHQPLAFSGGHNHHSAARPKGTFQPAFGNTGTTGLVTTYTSPEVSGIIDTMVTDTLANGTPARPGRFTIGVEVPNLVSLGAGTNYILVGALPARHGDNHYGTASFNGSLVALADSYAAAVPGGRFTCNDMSLVTGGLFDVGGAWAAPHSSHRFGVDMDLGLVPVAERRRLRQLIAASGISTAFVEGNHRHLRQ